MSSDHTPHPESSPRATEQKTTQPHVTQKTIGAFPASLREMLPTPGTSPVSGEETVKGVADTKAIPRV